MFSGVADTNSILPTPALSTSTIPVADKTVPPALAVAVTVSSPSQP
jgi:hypothetical protein